MTTMSSLTQVSMMADGNNIIIAITLVLFMPALVLIYKVRSPQEERIDAHSTEFLAFKVSDIHRLMLFFLMF